MTTSGHNWFPDYWPTSVSLWLRPQTTAERIKLMDWSRFVGRTPIGIDGKSYYMVRMYLRKKEPHFTIYGSPHTLIVVDGESYQLMRVWLKRTDGRRFRVK